MSHRQFGGVIQFLRRTAGGTAAAEATDRELLRQFATHRGEDAFALLVRRHGPMVLAACRRVLGNHHAAEDAFQATFLVLARKAASVRWDESVAGWLHEVAYRVARKAGADAARRRLHERQGLDMVAADADAEVHQRELRAVLDEELTRLPGKYRQPLILCYLEGKTNEEAATQLGWTKGTVSGRLARARDLLRGRLARRGLALSAAALSAAVAEGTQAATLSPSLLSQTIQAATGGIVAPPVATLAEGTLQTMFWTKFKTVALLFLGLSAITGTGVVGYRALANGQQANSVAIVTPLPEPERTRSAPEDKMVASKPVRVNGVDFQVVATRRWLGPVAEKKDGTAIEISLRVSNRTDKTLAFFAHGQMGIHVKGADGKELRVERGREQVGILRPIRIAAGKSGAIPVGGKFFQWDGEGLRERRDDNLIVSGSFPDGFHWSIHPLPGGKYALSLSYTPPGPESSAVDGGKACRVKDIENVWQGQVRTMEVPVEVVKPAVAAATPLPDPEANSATKPAPKLSAAAEKWVKRLKANLDKFQLRFEYFGPQDKPFYQVTLQVAAPPKGNGQPEGFERTSQLTKSQAEKLIDLLAEKGFLDHAWDVSRKDIARPKGPTYVLFIDEKTGDLETQTELMFDVGWGANLLRSLEEIRPVLEGKAREDMDFLLGRLGVQRK